MEPCPKCGAQNSVLRTTCYQCGEALPFGGAPRGPTQGPEGPREREAVASPQPRLDMAMGSVVHGSLPHVRAAAVFFRQFTGLVQAGFTVALALDHLTNSGPGRYRAAVREMSVHTAAGGRLSDAMRAHPSLFFPWQVGLVGAGEAGGFLPEVLNQIAASLESEYRMRLEIVWRTSYLVFVHLPVILLLLPLALALTHPPPGGGNWTLPRLGQAYAYWFPRSTLPAAAILVGLAVCWQFAMQVPGFRAVVQRIGLELPLVGHLSRMAAMTRFTEMLGALWRAGVSPATAVEVAAGACGNIALGRRLMAAAAGLRRGEPLTEALARTGMLPDDLVQLMRTGEVSGNLAESVGHVAGYYRGDLDRSLRTLPKVVAFAAWAVLLVVGLALVWAFFQIYVHYRWEVPLSEIERGVP